MKLRSLKIMRARQPQKSSTDAEKTLWQDLRSRQLFGHRFKRRHPIGNYFVDFVCLESNLVVELDGGQHLESSEYDAARAAYLRIVDFRSVALGTIRFRMRWTG